MAYKKQGIDYFALDVDFVTNRKIKKIVRACGPKGFIVLVHTLCCIYKYKGYYVKWDNETAFDISDQIGGGIQEATVRTTIEQAVKVGFFTSLEIDGETILTSPEIQSRYQQSTRKRGVNYNSLPYWLTPSNEIEAEKTDILTEKTDILTEETTQSKVKKSKVNNSIVYADQNPPTVNEFILFFKNNGYDKEYAEKVYNYYNDADWRDSRGARIINWKQKCRGNWFKKENQKISSKSNLNFYD